MAGAPVSNLLAHKWPWFWTYCFALEKRWEQIAEVGSIYGDDGEPPPKEWWHDTDRVDEWIEQQKAKKEEERSRR